jgi:hypothetical protein
LYHSSLRAERPGTEIGPYKLLEQIGEGAWAWYSWPISLRAACERKPALDLFLKTNNRRGYIIERQCA